MVVIYDNSPGRDGPGVAGQLFSSCSASNWRMPVDRRKGDHKGLPPLEVYEPEFRAKFGREMTPEERRFYDLTRQLFSDFKESIDPESEAS